MIDKLRNSSNSSMEDYSLIDTFPDLIINATVTGWGDRSPTTDNLAFIELALKYLMHLKEPAKILSNPRASKAIAFIRSLTYRDEYRENERFNNSILKFSIERIFVDVLYFCFDDTKKYIQQTTANTAAATTSMAREQQIKNLNAKFVNVNAYVEIVWYFSDRVAQFRNKFHECGGTKALLNYLEDANFVKCCIQYRNGDANLKESDYIGHKLLRAIICTILNISKIGTTRRRSFEEIKATEILRKFAIQVKNYDGHRICAHIALANIITDNDIEKFSNINSIIDDIVRLIKLSAQQIKDKTSLKRIKVDSDDKGTLLSDDMCVINHEGILWPFVDLINALYRIALNDSMKADIFEFSEFKESSESILAEGNTNEKELTVKLVWQLCFNEKVAQQIKKHSNIYNVLEQIVHDKTIQNGYLKVRCNGVLWTIDKSKAVRFAMLRTPSSNDYKKNLLMISYNRESKDFCLKLKTSLEKAGYKIWLDIEDVNSLSLESMSRATDQAWCGIICITEKYKQSPYCRAEAQYMYRSGLPLIPLIAQAECVPEGWLNFIIEMKNTINFARLPYDESIKKLSAELSIVGKSIAEDRRGGSDQVQKVESEPIFRNNSPNSIMALQPTAPITELPEDVKTWSERDVFNWLCHNKFDKEIIKIFRNFTGEMFVELNTTRCMAPEFFFNTISQNGKIDILSVLKFSKEFKNLFSQTDRKIVYV